VATGAPAKFPQKNNTRRIIIIDTSKRHALELSLLHCVHARACMYAASGI
jgi:hypothetical protein